MSTRQDILKNQAEEIECSTEVIEDSTEDNKKVIDEKDIFDYNQVDKNCDCPNCGGKQRYYFGEW
jgi:hypothetical protein